MKKLFAIALLLGSIYQQVAAKDGYKIQIKFKDLKDSTYFLAHYFAKPLPTIYKTDSGKLDKMGSSILKSDKKITGGMYLIMLSDRKTYFEFLLNNGDDIVITVENSKELPVKGLTIKNSVENEGFIGYEEFVRKVGEEHQELSEQLTKAKNSIDSSAIKDKMNQKMRSLVSFRNDFIAKNPNSLLAKIFKGLELPKVPEGKHFLPNGNEDKDFAYNYYKAHYWDNFDLKEGRLINTPIYDARITEYFEKLVFPVPDSVIKDMNWILAQTRGSGDMFNYTLSWLANFTQESKVMGMDKAYVYLFDNYYEKGDASWLSTDLLEKHRQHANNLRPNLIGNVGYDISMIDTSGNPVTVSKIQAKYKLIVIWDPTCGHCMKEIPALDSTYKADKLKSRGLKMIGICAEQLEKTWKEFIIKHQLSDWIHIHDPERKSNYKSMYNARVNPTIILLDEKGIIRGKSIDHTNITTLIDMLERIEAESKKKSSK
jgi:thiol-disulfide isomerase/thioredoxin